MPSLGFLTRGPRIFACILLALSYSPLLAQDFQKLQYNNPGLVVDLGVGLWAWPLPMDWDQDGDLDLIVSCPDKPYSGIYFFENRQPGEKLPVFEPGVRVGDGRKNVQVSHIDSVPRVTESNVEFTDFLGRDFGQAKTRTIYSQKNIHPSQGNQRFNVWSFVDYDGDGRVDILVGADDWGPYGWDDGYDERGRWKRGHLEGAVYVLLNTAPENAEPIYAEPVRLEADGSPLQVYGNPMPNMADFDGDGDFDLICGEFLDGLTYFENIGSRTQPAFSSRGYLTNKGSKIRMHVQMITPSAIDWDRDDDVDLVVGDEDGRVALIENTGRIAKGQPEFLPPRYFQQKARDLKFGALITPVGYDWDSDGDEDLVCGNTSGNIAWFENMDGAALPMWSAPQLIDADGSPIHIQAGANGSIQGPAEAKWGYTTLSVADWDQDGRHDLVVNSIWGKVDWFRNVGSATKPVFQEAQPVRVLWNGPPPKPAWTWWTPEKNQLVTQWRTTPVVEDWDQDGDFDLIMLDHEGYLAFYERVKQGGQLWLKPGRRIFAGSSYDSKHRGLKPQDPFLRLNGSEFGGSGRRKLCIADWDHDGMRDLLVNSANVNWLRNSTASSSLSSPSNDGGLKPRLTFEDMGLLDDQILAGHTTSPTTVDWDGDGFRDLVVGAEDGRLYFLRNPYSK